MANSVQLNEKAVLIQNPQGDIHLFYDQHLYARSDVVPDRNALDGQSLGAGKRGADYVIACLVKKYGPSVGDWPDLARRYLVRDESK